MRRNYLVQKNVERTWEVGTMMGFKFVGEKCDVLNNLMAVKARDQEAMKERINEGADV